MAIARVCAALLVGATPFIVPSPIGDPPRPSPEVRLEPTALTATPAPTDVAATPRVLADIVEALLQGHRIAGGP